MRRAPNFLISLSLSLLAAVQFAGTASADKGVTDYFPPIIPVPVTPAPSPLQGSARTYSSGTSATSPLQGGIKQESSLNPSLRLTPQYQGKVQTGGYSLTPMRGQYVPETIRGGVHSAGTDGGISDGPVQFYGDKMKGSNGSIYGVIPPVTTYHRTPPTGVIDYIPGSSVSYATTGSSHSEYGGPEHYKTIGRGVTVLSRELTVSSVRVPVPMFLGNLPGSALSTVQTRLTAMQTVTPGQSGSSIIKNFLPGGDQTGYVTNHGITTAPGYEVTVIPGEMHKETLGGRFSANSPIASRPIELSAVPYAMQTEHIFNRIEPAAEVAKTGVLASLQPGKCDTWAQWYRAMAQTIYRHWQDVDVCPGTAKLQVTVKSDHDISAQVVEFTPVADIERNVARETQFRETAVKIVNQIGFFEIPNFPNPPTSQVVFDIDLKRTVNGPTGISVVGVPSK